MMLVAADENPCTDIVRFMSPDHQEILRNALRQLTVYDNVKVLTIDLPVIPPALLHALCQIQKAKPPGKRRGRKPGSKNKVVKEKKPKKISPSRTKSIASTMATATATATATTALPASSIELVLAAPPMPIPLPPPPLPPPPPPPPTHIDEELIENIKAQLAAAAERSDRPTRKRRVVAQPEIAPYFDESILQMRSTEEELEEEKEFIRKHGYRGSRLYNGSSKPILYKFMLDCLMDIRNQEIISWRGENLEFVLDLKLLSGSWGTRKGRGFQPNHIQESAKKLERTLRDYYPGKKHGGIIEKCIGIRHGWKFLPKAMEIYFHDKFADDDDPMATWKWIQQQIADLVKDYRDDVRQKFGIRANGKLSTSSPSSEPPPANDDSNLR